MLLRGRDIDVYGLSRIIDGLTLNQRDQEGEKETGNTYKVGLCPRDQGESFFLF